MLFHPPYTALYLAIGPSSLSLSLSLSSFSFPNLATPALLPREREKAATEIIHKMAINCKISFGICAAFALIFAISVPAVHAHGHDAFAPAPPPTSDGTSIDQGIAYVLMVLALVLTYIIHTFDAPFSI